MWLIPKNWLSPRIEVVQLQRGAHLHIPPFAGLAANISSMTSWVTAAVGEPALVGQRRVQHAIHEVVDLAGEFVAPHVERDVSEEVGDENRVPTLPVDALVALHEHLELVVVRDDFALVSQDFHLVAGLAAAFVAPVDV